MKYTQTTLAGIFRAADQAAKNASGTHDGGTCNFDSPVFFPERGLRNALIEAAAVDAGIRIGIRPWFGRRCVFLYVGRGQANQNTVMSEAAYQVLKTADLDAMMYYQMD